MSGPILTVHADSAGNSRVVEDQSRQNRSTANQWSLYSTHRRALERLLVPPQHGVERICVLGAGNCNDLDLQWLLKAYAEVHLVDLDPHALTAAVSRQRVSTTKNLFRHAPVDLTGAANEFDAWTLKPPGFSQIDSLAARLLLANPPALPGPFDAVLSSCLLTQLISPARKSLGLDHPKLPSLRLAIRDAHLLTLAKLVRPAGRAVVAIDLVSSDTFAGLQRVAAADLPDLMAALISRRKTYPGLDPGSITDALRSPLLRPKFGNPTFSAPWHWHLSLQRTFSVYGMTLIRAPFK